MNRFTLAGIAGLTGLSLELCWLIREAMNSIADNIARVRERIAAAAARAGRQPSRIKLVAISKTKSTALIREAYEAGQRVFGENYAQELRDKARELADLDIEWHYVGHLQRNKAKFAAEFADMVETVDSKELADELVRQAAKRPAAKAAPLGCLIEVNIGDESSKSGAKPADLAELARYLLALPDLRFKGLMIIPPYDSDPEKSRPCFARLRELLDSLIEKISPIQHIEELSMGMSHDFEAAIEEGSTIIRVGTAIFGGRD